MAFADPYTPQQGDVLVSAPNLAPGYAVLIDPATGKARRIVNVGTKFAPHSGDWAVQIGEGGKTAALGRASQDQGPGGAWTVKWTNGFIGSPPNRVDPFLTPEQQIAYGDAVNAWNTQMGGIDMQLTQGESDRNYGIAQTDDSEKRNIAASIENMAARGISGSSIEKGETSDIAATAALRRQYFNDTFDTLSTWAKTAKSNLNNWRYGDSGFEKSYDQLKVGNATEASKNLPPAPATLPPPINPPPIQAGPAPAVKGPGQLVVSNDTPQVVRSTPQQPAGYAQAVSAFGNVPKRVSGPKKPKRPPQPYKARTA